jgi:hypothetical protein
MKTKITLSVDSEVVLNARAILASDGISISEFLTTKLQEIVRKRSSYARAKKRALARLRSLSHNRWVRPASRDELHER